MKHIISFSGGKDSTAMLLLMVEKKMQIDKIVCVDTTKEFPQMYEHIEKVQSMINIPIDIITIKFDYYFSDHIKTRGKNKGKMGYGFPDFRNRWCTALKREIIKKKQKELGKDIIEYHGIAADEAERAKNNKDRNIRYPLIKWGMEEKDALEYCYSKGLDWGCLYEKMYRVSCWCCPLSRIGELRVLHNEFPLLWEELKKMDKKSYRDFRSDYTFDELSLKFEKENQNRIQCKNEYSLFN